MQVTIKIPAAHVGCFRLGLLRELAFEGRWIKDQAKEARRALERAQLPGVPRTKPIDPVSDFLNGPLGEVENDAETLRQLPVQAEGDVDVEAEPVSLKHTLEAVARHCAKHLSGCEFGSEEARQWADTLAWAAQEADRLEVEVVLPELRRQRMAAAGN